MSPTGAPSGEVRLRPLAGWLPELDGIRGLAVMVVLAFHSELDAAPGGYIGVSVFFTLSGYLITALVLDEVSDTGRFEAGRFVLRRLRRLAPAALATLAGVVALGATGVIGPRPSELRPDLLAALGQAANWRFAATRSYAALFDDRSPVQHFWSLGLEEQLYFGLVLLVLAAALVAQRLFPRRRSAFRFVLGTALGAVLAVSLVRLLSVDGFDRWYYGTDTRAAEFVAGALLAVLAYRRRWRVPLPPAVVAVAGLAGLGWIVATLELGQLAASPAWLLATSAASLALLAGAATGEGTVRLLAWDPLVWVGRRSYGLYLVHWPIFLVADEHLDRQGVAVPVQLLASLATAALLFRFVEAPTRRLRLTFAPLAPALAVVAGLVALAVNVVPDPEGTERGLAALRDELAPPARPAAAATSARGPTLNVPTTSAARPATPGPTLTRTPTHAPTGPTATRPTVTPPPTLAPFQALATARLAIVGDSQALRLAFGMADWGRETGRAEVVFLGNLGCAIARNGLVRYRLLVAEAPGDGCVPWYDGFAADLAAFDPDLVVVLTGAVDLADRFLPDDDEWRAPGDPRFDANLAVELGLAQQRFTAGEWRTVWLRPPPFDADIGELDYDEPADRPERLAVLHGLIDAIAAGQVVDLAGFFATCPDGSLDTSLRPDGLHLTEASARYVARWLGPILLGDGPPDLDPSCADLLP